MPRRIARLRRNISGSAWCAERRSRQRSRSRSEKIFGSWSKLATAGTREHGEIRSGFLASHGVTRLAQQAGATPLISQVRPDWLFLYSRGKGTIYLIACL